MLGRADSSGCDRYAATDTYLRVAIVGCCWQLSRVPLKSMSVSDRKLELLENILRLRRAGRAVPGNQDIAAVRAALEAELGETVSRRLAARALGVSHTALERWITRGDLPVVYSETGRVEVPVPALLDLRESVDADREQQPRRYVLAPTMARQRDAAKRLHIDEFADGADGHDRATARSRAYHRAVAQRLRRPMVDEARHVLYRWRRQGRIDERWAARWEEILSRPVSDVRSALVEDSQEADDLRQNSPFAGMLSEPERRRIVSEVR